MNWGSTQIKKLRMELGWSQAELGRRLGLSLDKMQALEAGQMTIDTETIVALDRMNQHLSDYSRALRFSSHSETYIKENCVNQISYFDLESIEEN